MNTPLPRRVSFALLLLFLGTLASWQAAVRIDPGNVTYRILLAEFFIQYHLLKRAEGELNRLLTMYPSNREARQLLSQFLRVYNERRLHEALGYRPPAEVYFAATAA